MAFSPIFVSKRFQKKETRYSLRQPNIRLDFNDTELYLITYLLTSGLTPIDWSRHRAVTAIVANHICFQFFFLHFCKIDPLSYCCFPERVAPWFLLVFLFSCLCFH